MPLAAVIFDLDGVVIDSHDAHRHSWFQLAAELGREMTEAQFKASFGQRNESIIPWLGWADSTDSATVRRLGDRKEELYRAILRQQGITPLPGVVHLLDRLAGGRIPAALGTSTPLANVECVLELTGLGPRFRAIVAAGDVRRGKPDPEVFVTAAGRLAVAPADCVVIEDAHAGLRAARAGGMKTVAVATTHPPASLRAESPDLVLDSLEHLDLAVLRGLW